MIDTQSNPKIIFDLLHKELFIHIMDRKSQKKLFDIHMSRLSSIQRRLIPFCVNMSIEFMN